MKRTIAIGDIHGGLRALTQVLEIANVTTKDHLIFMGDLVDGWSESYKLIDFLIDLNQKQSCIFIKGNHDLYCEYWLNTAQNNPEWEKHGGKETQAGYLNKSESEKKKHLQFFQGMKYYHVDNKHRLFIHAGYTSMDGPEGESSASSYMWDRTLLEMAIAMDDKLDRDSIRYPKRLKHFEEIFIGHTPTQKHGQETPIHAANLWDIDTGAAFKGCLTAMDVDTKEFWQSEPVWKLYSGEVGRNKG